MKKRFDAVQFQRKEREKLGKEYSKNRRTFIAKLEEKFGSQKKRAA